MTGRTSVAESHAKQDRALELYEKGLSPSVIAERLCIRRGHVSGLLRCARARREKAKKAGEVGA